MGSRNTELITWSNTLACGIKIIDDQHKGLVDLVNEMYNHVIGDESRENEYFNRVIQEAVQYIKVHFATEEKILKAVKFPGYAEHKKAHDGFILTVVENIKDYKSGKRISISSFTKYLKEWILSHIAVMDKNYFEHIKKIADRNTN